MTKPIIRIHNTETNEIIDREMSDDEYQDYLNDINASAEKLAAEKTEKENKLAILRQLGLTDEQAIILGLLPKNDPLVSDAQEL